MPQRKHMAKHLRQTAGRTYRNRLRKRTIKSEMRELLDAARAGDAEAVAAGMPGAQKALDKAAQRGVIHKRTAARRKARLVAQAKGLLDQG
jgi:small subunit ribosomal protein S20